MVRSAGARGHPGVRNRGSVRCACRGLYGAILLVALVSALQPAALKAHDADLPAAQILAVIGFDQRLGDQAPLDLRLQDETGQTVTLGNYFGAKPVILALGYYTCPNLCPLVRHGLTESLRQISLDAGQAFEVVMVSIDPQETPTDAARAKVEQLAAYERPDTAAGWHFLTGDHATIDQLAAAIGFRYAYDAQQQQYAHASGVVVLTPRGEIARYLLGLDYRPRDLRLALVEAADQKIGSPLDQVLLFCYHYNPITGQYNLLIMNILRLAGFATVLGLGGLVWGLVRREANVGDKVTR
jgi:protein SCO1